MSRKAVTRIDDEVQENVFLRGKVLININQGCKGLASIQPLCLPPSSSCFPRHSLQFSLGARAHLWRTLAHFRNEISIDLSGKSIQLYLLPKLVYELQYECGGSMSTLTFEFKEINRAYAFCRTRFEQ